MLYMVTFTINIPPMLAYIPYMDPMGWTLLADTKHIKWGRLGKDHHELCSDLASTHGN